MLADRFVHDGLGWAVRTIFLQLRKQVSTVRVRWPAEELRRRGHDVRAYSYGAALAGPVDRGDTVVLHVTAELGVHMLPVVRQLASFTRTVVQFDDNWLALSDIQDLRHNPMAREFLSQIPAVCALSSSVIVSTPELERVYAPWSQQISVVRNTVPRWVTERRTRAPNAEDRLVWMGRFGVHTADWEQLAPYVKDLPPLLLAGSGQRGVDLLRSWGASGVIATPGTDKTGLLYRTMSRGRAAIVPLRPGRFNAGKSWLKPLEFSALGVPVVAADHPEYAALSQIVGSVVIASDPESMVRMAWQLYDRNERAGKLPDSLILEHDGGTAWETALGLTRASLR